MYNLIISLVAASVAFVVGAQFGSWTAGIIPALIALAAAWIVLVRRTSKQLEGIMGAAGKEFEAGRVESGKRLIESARPLAKWQFLLEEQIDGQLGAVEYMQRNYKAARPLLEKGGARSWNSQGMLAAMDIRTNNRSKAVKRMLGVKKVGKKDPIMWGVLAYACVQDGQVDLALESINEALGGKELAESGPLKAIQGSLQNGKAKKIKWAKTFGQPWLMYFPEQATAKMMQGQMYAGNRKTYPMPRR